MEPKCPKCGEPMNGTIYGVLTPVLKVACSGKPSHEFELRWLDACAQFFLAPAKHTTGHKCDSKGHFVPDPECEVCKQRMAALPEAERLAEKMYTHHKETWNKKRNPTSVLTPVLESWEQTNQHNREYWTRMAQHALAALGESNV